MWGANTADEMKAIFAGRGVSPQKPVVVYGGWQTSWGYEARILWMLKSLGHQKAYILNGGIGVYNATYTPNISTTPVVPEAVQVSVWSSDLNAAGFQDIIELKDNIDSDDLIIDTRTEPEYNGSVSGPQNYNVKRDGHLTGAVLFTFGDFFSGSCLKSCATLKAALDSRGWKEGMDIVAYCTAGIRSAFFWAYATHCGISGVANYGGSMWEYAADSSKPMTIGNLPRASSNDSTTTAHNKDSSASTAKNVFSAAGLLLATFWHTCSA